MHSIVEREKSPTPRASLNFSFFFLRWSFSAKMNNMNVLNLSAVGLLAKALECPPECAQLKPIQVIGVTRDEQCIAHSYKILFVSRLFC